MRVLVVEDSPVLVRTLRQGLSEEGLSVDTAMDGEEGLHMASEVEYDVIVLDRMLPKMDGLQVLTTLRKRGRRMPVLLLTALGEVQHRVGGLDAGADDYLVKPFAFDELLARIRALHRRRAGVASNLIQMGPLEIDLGARVVKVQGRPLTLTAREYGLLELLVLHPQETFSRTVITEKLYAEDTDRDSNVIDVFVARVRKKLDQAGLPGSSLIVTQRGEGYRFDPTPLGSPP